MSETADIVIIGGGVMGASIAYQLAKQQGGRVVLFERQALCNGTTGRSGAIVRQHYSNEFTIRMAKASLEVFQHFDDVVGGDCGFLTMGMVMMVGEEGAEALYLSSYPPTHVALEPNVVGSVSLHVCRRSRSGKEEKGHGSP